MKTEIAGLATLVMDLQDDKSGASEGLLNDLQHHDQNLRKYSGRLGVGFMEGLVLCMGVMSWLQAEGPQERGQV